MIRKDQFMSRKTQFMPQAIHSSFLIFNFYKKRKPERNIVRAGADERSRTGDLILTKDALYLLSYISKCRFTSTCAIISPISRFVKGFLKKTEAKQSFLCFNTNMFPKWNLCSLSHFCCAICTKYSKNIDKLCCIC